VAERNGSPEAKRPWRCVFSTRALRQTVYRIGMWVAMASILMLFTALSSAYIVRAASG